MLGHVFTLCFSGHVYVNDITKTVEVHVDVLCHDLHLFHKSQACPWNIFLFRGINMYIEYEDLNTVDKTPLEKL